MIENFCINLSNVTLATVTLAGTTTTGNGPFQTVNVTLKTASLATVTLAYTRLTNIHVRNAAVTIIITLAVP